MREIYHLPSHAIEFARKGGAGKVGARLKFSATKFKLELTQSQYDHVIACAAILLILQAIFWQDELTVEQLEVCQEQHL